MVDKTIRKALKKRNGEYKFNDLLTFMENTGITFIDRRLNGPLSITTLDAIIVDVSNFYIMHDKVVFFIFIHEIAHMKRLKKYGKEWFLKQMSINDFDEFLTELFKEEVLADRYGCRIFYKLNGITYPWPLTQQLNLPEKQKAYAPMTKGYFGKINNNEETYRMLIQSFIE